MSEKVYNLVIATPDKIFFEGNVESIILRTTEGELCILKGHEAFVAVLKNETIHIDINGERKHAFVSGGFIEVKPNKVRIITDAAEWPSEINLDRANKAKQRAEERLARKENINIQRAEYALARAIARINTYNNYN